MGKSWFHRLVWWEHIARWDGKFRPGAPSPGVRCTLLMPTFKHCVDVHRVKVLEELDETNGPWRFLGGKPNRSTWRIEFPGGSWVQWFGALEADSARGHRTDIVTIDEADDVHPAIVDSVVGPWLSEPHSLKIRVIGGTPRRGRRGLLYRTHKEGLDGVPGVFTRHATYRDAPKQVDQGYVERECAKLLRQGQDQIWQREWECNFDSAEGLVYPQFFESFHVREPAQNQHYSEIIFGADHGYEDPGVILKIGVIGKGADAIYWVLDEVYERHRDPPWWLGTVRTLAGAHPGARWYADPSQPGTLVSWQKAGARVQRTDNAVEDGISAVASALAIVTRGEERRARLFIHPRCRNILNEFGLYRRRRDARDRERVLDAVDDTQNDHAMDALRYAIFNRFPPTLAPRRGLLNIPQQ